MTNYHLRYLLLFFLACACMGIKAQSFSLGGGLAFGSRIENAGINLRGYYNLDEKIRLGTDFTFFFPKTRSIRELYSNGEGYFRSTVWELNFNGSYLAEISENLQLYPLFGLNITGIKTVYNYDLLYRNWLGTITIRDSYYYIDNDTEVGVNLGGGLQYKINKLAPFFEFKYIISYYDQVVLNMGLLYTIE